MKQSKCFYIHFSTDNSEMQKELKKLVRHKKVNLFDCFLFRDFIAEMNYNNEIVIKQSLVAVDYEVSERNIRYSLKRLVEEGLIRKVKNTRPPVYMVNPIYAFKGTKENHQKLFDKFFGL